MPDAVKQQPGNEFRYRMLLGRIRHLARETFDDAHQGLRQPVGGYFGPEQAGLLLGADVVGNHRHQLILERFRLGHLEETDACQVGVFLQDAQQTQHAALDALGQFGAFQSGGQARFGNRLAQALREHADQFIVGRLLAGKVLVEHRLRHAGASDDVADTRVLETALRELGRGNFK